MKLKGNCVKKLPLEKKKKMEETLQRMEEVRQRDDRYLRVIIEEKLDWAKKLREQGMELIQKNQLEVMKLGSIIFVLEEILAKKNVETEQNTEKNKIN